MGDTVIYTCKDGVARLVLNRPGALNALNTALRADLLAALHKAGAESRVIILTGAGRAFCAGQDLRDLGEEDTPQGDDFERILNDEYLPILNALTTSACPVIAAVNGPAVGAGANLALACDIVIAAHSAYFQQAFTRIGLIPDAGGTHILPRLIGRARAMGAMLLADPIPAQTAADWGMIWAAAPDAALEAEVQDIAARLARGPARAQAAVKAALAASASNDFAAQLALESRLQGQLGGGPEFRAGRAAFLAKRPPDFNG